MFKARQRRQWLQGARWHMKPPRIPNKKMSRVQKPDENGQIDPRRHWPSHNPWDGSVDHFDFKQPWSWGGRGDILAQEVALPDLEPEQYSSRLHSHNAK